MANETRGQWLMPEQISLQICPRVRLTRLLAIASIAFCTDVGGAAAFEVSLSRPKPLREGKPVDILYPHPLPLSGEQVSGKGNLGVLMTVDGLDDSAKSLFMQVFTISYAGPFDAVEKWIAESGAPGPENPLRFTALYDAFFGQEHGGIVKDDHGDSCVGYFLKAEICLQALGCLPLAQGSGKLEVWVPTTVATNYRLETFVSPSGCDGGMDTSSDTPWLQYNLRRLADTDVGKGVLLASGRHALQATSLPFRVIFVDEPSSWWAAHPEQAPLVPTVSWMEMMNVALEAAEQWVQIPNALWLEFGVASGRSIAFIAWRLAKVAPHVVVHGFDSFKGIPVGWHRYNPESFSMEGKPPEFLEQQENVKLHVGYFSDTLPDLDRFRSWPVAFVHVDSDLFQSGWEVLSYLRCQLVPGTVIVFDEWFNYAGWHADGEYKAWTLLTSTTGHGLKWRPLGIFFEQAFAMIIEERSGNCG